MESDALDDMDIRLRGIDILNKELGPYGALRFLSLIQYEPTDYVEVSRRLYDGQTIEDIYQRRRAERK